MATLSNRTYWQIVIGVAFVFRLVALIYIPTVPISDFWSYFQRAISIADRRVYEAIPGIRMLLVILVINGMVRFGRRSIPSVVR